MAEQKQSSAERLYVQLIGISDDYSGCRDIADNIAAELDALKKERNEAEAKVRETRKQLEDWVTAQTAINKLPRATRDGIYNTVRAQRYLRRNRVSEAA